MFLLFFFCWKPYVRLELDESLTDLCSHSELNGKWLTITQFTHSNLCTMYGVSSTWYEQRSHKGIFKFNWDGFFRNISIIDRYACEFTYDFFLFFLSNVSFQRTLIFNWFNLIHSNLYLLYTYMAIRLPYKLHGPSSIWAVVPDNNSLQPSHLMQLDAIDMNCKLIIDKNCTSRYEVLLPALGYTYHRMDIS